MFNRILSIVLILVLVCSLFVGCDNASKPQATEPTNGTTGETIGNNQTDPMDETQNDDAVNPTEPQSKNKLEAADLALYGAINENSQYVAAVAHNGNIESSSYAFAKKTYVGIYDIGKALKDTAMLSDTWMKCASQNNFLYNMGLGNENGAFICIINNDNYEDGSVDYAPVQSVDDNGVNLLGGPEYTVTFEVNQGYENDYYVYGEDWLLSWWEETEDSLYMKIGETDKKNVYLLTTLKNAIKIDDNVVESVNSAIENNDFTHSIVILNNSDDLTSIEKTWGQEHNLSEVSFLQDILATKISNMYGLNLKSKDAELHLDNKYLIYRTHDENGKKIEVTFDYFPDASAYRNFRTTYEDFARFCEDSQKFSYTDDEGNVYEYFADVNFYIYKNKELMGVAKVKGADLFDGVSEIFGIKP